MYNTYSVILSQYILINCSIEMTSVRRTTCFGGGGDDDDGCDVLVARSHAAQWWECPRGGKSFSACCSPRAQLRCFHSELPEESREQRERSSPVTSRSFSSTCGCGSWVSCVLVGPVWCCCARRWRCLSPAGARRSRRMFRRRSTAPDARPGAWLCTWLSSPLPSDTSRYKPQQFLR